MIPNKYNHPIIMMAKTNTFQAIFLKDTINKLNLQSEFNKFTETLYFHSFDTPDNFSYHLHTSITNIFFKK